MITLLFFAGLKEAIGDDQIKMPAVGMTLGEVKEKVWAEYSIEQVKSCMVAVNEEFAPEETTIQEGDTIAFIPPVSGG
ncbi:molybdopterin synthase subunit MoaD [Halobacillus karajensis]|uniref:Molybdopterin synthase sulfur carrier subunit n=1 Tax=Halobacillus karajensis TaxID=195088 RepID=A0A024P7H5_9BACI|nr:molybdopterin converting factor subunit 1 [Halobacillus karajensis]CDQ21041.1 molybdopterin synthase small subunit [Halobacillus karajensis]CDQ24895.1 molybdopterin synthase small subunit [Halobacillus karajensis]CDQ28745.1 molybdopterin synthase small subunit [Halobacillus karajensis]SEH97066.1 molybdopterin synthase subunit MoaD [Halobacillus karajensis]